MANQQRRQADPGRMAVANDRTERVVGRDDEQITDDAVRARAHELYEQRGGEHEHAWDDWLQAERELRPEEDRHE